MCRLTFHFVWVGHHCSACEQGRAKEHKVPNKTLKAVRMTLSTRLPIRLQLLTFLLFQVELRIPLTFPNILGHLVRRRARARVAREETRLVPI